MPTLPFWLHVTFWINAVGSAVTLISAFTPIVPEQYRAQVTALAGTLTAVLTILRKLQNTSPAAMTLTDQRPHVQS